MADWILRPGRRLALLECIAFWPAWWVLGYLLVLPFEHAADTSSAVLLLIGIALMGTTTFTTLIAVQGSSIASLARRDVTFWLSASVLLAISWLALRLFSITPQTLVIILVGATSAGVAALFSLLLARVVSRWPSGVLSLVDGPHLVCDEVVYRLDGVPSGFGDGDAMTLPLLRRERQRGGPYRMGPAIAHAPIVLRVRGERLVFALRLRALGIGTWAVLSLALAASLA